MATTIQRDELNGVALSQKKTRSFDARKQYEALRRHYQSTVAELRTQARPAINGTTADTSFQKYVRQLWMQVTNKLATAS